MKGMIIIPITPPAAIALSEAISNPKLPAKLFKKGPTVIAAKKPYTTVGTPANISRIGLNIALTFGLAYSDK